MKNQKIFKVGKLENMTKRVFFSKKNVCVFSKAFFLQKWEAGKCSAGSRLSCCSVSKRKNYFQKTGSIPVDFHYTCKLIEASVLRSTRPSFHVVMLTFFPRLEKFSFCMCIALATSCLLSSVCSLRHLLLKVRL